MRVRRILQVLISVIAVTLGSSCVINTQDKYLYKQIFNDETLSKLKESYPLNLNNIYAGLGLQNSQINQPYLSANPFYPYTPLNMLMCVVTENCIFSSARLPFPVFQFSAQASVYHWFLLKKEKSSKAQVCGLKFSDEGKVSYTLKSFDNLHALQAAPGYMLTHYQQCGSCSTLQDLAVYAEKDLTFMARNCAKVFDSQLQLQCMKNIGFTERCAQMWAYNAQHTRARCAVDCIKEYGIVNIMLGTENTSNVNAQGQLNACLLCDEILSGPGFQYSVGRTRRNSGLVSEIFRPTDEIYTVEHNYY